MTPFGEKMRVLRAAHGRTLSQQAAFLKVSPAYISALEHGKRGRIAPALVDQICAWLGLIWDDAEELKQLAALSYPRPVIDTRALGPEATAAANYLARNIDRLSEADCAALSSWMKDRLR